MNRAGKTQGANGGEVTNLTPIALALHKTADHRNGYKATSVHRHGFARPRPSAFSSRKIRGAAMWSGHLTTDLTHLVVPVSRGFLQVQNFRSATNLNGLKHVSAYRIDLAQGTRVRPFGRHTDPILPQHSTLNFKSFVPSSPTFTLFVCHVGPGFFITAFRGTD